VHNEAHNSSCENRVAEPDIPRNPPELEPVKRCNISVAIYLVIGRRRDCRVDGHGGESSGEMVLLWWREGFYNGRRARGETTPLLFSEVARSVKCQNRVSAPFRATVVFNVHLSWSLNAHLGNFGSTGSQPLSRKMLTAKACMYLQRQGHTDSARTTNELSTYFEPIQWHHVPSFPVLRSQQTSRASAPSDIRLGQ
jgi:hypothetical protein